MKQKEKFFAVALLSFFCIAALGTEASAATKTTWKDYFSWNETKTIKDLIRTGLENGSGAWKKIISGKSIDKDAISESKIKDDAVTGDKIEDGTITGEDLASNISIDTTGTGAFTNISASGNGMFGGNVGIGTTGPGAKLDVRGDITTDSTHGVYLGGGADRNYYIKAGPNNGVMISGWNGVQLGYQGNATLTADSSGNVGIGTTGPGYKLDVNGDINIATGSNFKINGANLSPGSWVASGNNIYNSNSGNVGIGTSSPSERLDVRGGAVHIVATTAAANYANRANSIIFNPADVPTSFANKISNSFSSNSYDSTMNFEITNSAGDGFVTAMTLTGDGNVGIGTTSPTELLDVDSDTIRIRDAKTPSSASASCNQGEVVWDTSYVYVCVATDTWKRSAISTW